MIKSKIIYLLILFITLISIISSVSAATLKGNIYNSNFELEENVLIEIDLTTQQYLSKDGTYIFQLPTGEHNLTAKKGTFLVTETIIISNEGEIIYDIFLLDDFTDEDDLWDDIEDDPLANDLDQKDDQTNWSHIVAGILFFFVIIRLYRARKKYGSLRVFRKKVRVEQKKTVEEHKKDLADEPGYLERTLKIIKKHGGRISQKQLRKEMLDLSEAKVSLIITELEHKGKIEKIKKGRGNVLILK